MEEEREAKRLDSLAAAGGVASLPVVGLDLSHATRHSIDAAASSGDRAVTITTLTAGGVGSVNASTSGGGSAGSSEPARFRSSFEIDVDPNAIAMAARGRVPKKTLAVALFLLILGVILFIIGLVRLFRGEDGGLVMILLGGIAMLPGGYQTVVIFRAWRGHAGYNFNSVPSFD